jgi:signal transduction histidine kinase
VEAAGAALISAAAATCGTGRGVLLLRDAARLRAVAGVGVAEESLTGHAVFLAEEDHPLVRVLGAGPTVERDGAPFGFAYAALLPVPGCAEEEALGVVALELVVPAAELEAAQALLALCGPMLERIVELERLKAEAQRSEHQMGLLATIVDALPDAVFITGADGHVLLRNRRADALFSSTDTDSEGRRRAVELNHLLFSAFLTRGAAGNSPGSTSSNAPPARELTLVDPNEGGDLLVEVLSTPLPAALADGATISVLRDVTDLRRATTELEHQFKRVRHAEQKARRERDRLNLILENVSDPILVTDDQSNIILMNREAERLFETPPGTPPRSRRSQDVRANDTRFSSLISEFTLSPHGTRVGPLALRNPETGAEFPAEVASGKILNERAEMTAIVSIVHDLTKVAENERLAAELTELNEGLEDRVRSATEELAERNRQLEWQSHELERAYRLKSQFLASMSHELRTPINALLGYTSLMRDQIYGSLTARQEEALDRMYSASQHLLELVNDILDLAKIEAGKMPVHIEHVPVGMLLRELSQTIEPMVRGKGLAYELELAPDLPTLETDRTKVKQILLNLLSNAVKFTHQGSIALRAHALPEGRGVELAVSDTGIGIAPADIPKIFDDFRQVDQSSTREYGGTGLGLSITKKLLALLGGSIGVESKVGEGSTFIVHLPLGIDDPVSG